MRYLAARPATSFLVAASLVLYSLWILIVSASFWVIRLDNLAYLFSAVFDAARWPIQIFRGVWLFVAALVVALVVVLECQPLALWLPGFMK